MGLLGKDNEVWALADTIWEPFRDRNTRYDHRRKVRYRQMGQELAQLPLNPRVKDTALMVYQSEVPNQEAHQRVKRLVANPVRFEVIVFDDTPESQRRGQDLENGLKGLYKWSTRNRGSSWDVKGVQFQQGDGLGIVKITWVPGHGDVLGLYDEDDLLLEDEEVNQDGISDMEQLAREGRNASRAELKAAAAKLSRDDPDRMKKAFDTVTDNALKREAPPIKFAAVNPTACAWWADEDGVEIMVERGTRTLNPLLDAMKGAGLTLSKDGSRLSVTKTGDNVVSGDTVPGDTVGGSSTGRSNSGLVSNFNYAANDQQVAYTELRTRTEIVIMLEHPKLKDKAKNKVGGRGVVLRFDNPFGPYTTGYALMPGDETTESNPADMYQPPILAALNGAQPQNVLMTARLSASLEEALSPEYVKVGPEVPLSPSDEDKTVEVDEGREVPVIPGEIKRVPGPNTDMKEIDLRIAQDAAIGAFNDELQGAAASEATGHRLAIQVAQADLQMVPYQNSRAKAIQELMMGAMYAVRRHGLVIFIPVIPEGARKGAERRVGEFARITPEMADLSFELVVTLGAETPVSKYAKWAALRDREEAGTIGYQTVMEQSDVENPEAEIQRVFEGKMLKATMDQAIPLLTQMLMEHIQQLINPQPDQNIQAEQEAASQFASGEGGVENGGGNQSNDLLRMRGRGMDEVINDPEGNPIQMEGQSLQ